MRRRFMVVLAVIGAFAIAIPAVAASQSGAGGRAFTVVERAETDAVIDLGAAGDSIGDLLAFGNPIFDRTNTNEVGRDEGQCIRTNPGLSWECSWTTILANGAITVQGPFTDDGKDSQLAITGGSGAYRNARGQMTLHWRNAGGTEFDFIFQVIGG
jgi:allene oxide cyclase